MSDKTNQEALKEIVQELKELGVEFKPGEVVGAEDVARMALKKLVQNLNELGVECKPGEAVGTEDVAQTFLEQITQKLDELEEVVVNFKHTSEGAMGEKEVEYLEQIALKEILQKLEGLNIKFQPWEHVEPDYISRVVAQRIVDQNVDELVKNITGEQLDRTGMRKQAQEIAVDQMQSAQQIKEQFAENVKKDPEKYLKILYKENLDLKKQSAQQSIEIRLLQKQKEENFKTMSELKKTFQQCLEKF
jgi:hypothetical protein